MKKASLSLILIFALILGVTGCYEWPASIYQPGDGDTVPTISGLSATSLYGGIDQVTISGSGFGTERDEVIVYFKKGTTVGRARTLSVADDAVVVEAPVVYSDSLETWIDKRGCFTFAKDTVNLVTILNGMNAVGVDTANGYATPISAEVPNCVAVGSSDDVYVDVAGKAFSHILPDRSRNEDQEAISDKDITGMKLTTTDLYYTVAYYLVKHSIADGSTVKTKKPDGKKYYYDFDFADNGFTYLCGDDGILSVASDFTSASTPVMTAAETDYEMSACAVFGSDLYAAGKYVGIDSLQLGINKIWKYAINADGSLGAKTIVIDWDTQFAGSNVTGIAFADDGKMFVSTATTTPIYAISPIGGSYADGTITLLYQLLLDQKVLNISWDNTTTMGIVFASSTDPVVKSVYNLKMQDSPSPYYAP